MVIVTGRHRSGTSLMMRMLEAGGVPVLVDDWRTPDQWNPHGYYEYGEVGRFIYPHVEAEWAMAHVQAAVKFPRRILPNLPDWLPVHILLMLRPIEAVRESWALMDGRPEELDDDGLAWLIRSGRPYMGVQYDCVIRHPLRMAVTIASFLRGYGSLDVRAMAATVDPELRHH